MERDLEERTRGPISFSGMMNNIELAQEKHLKKTRKIKIGLKGKKQFYLQFGWTNKDKS